MRAISVRPYCALGYGHAFDSGSMTSLALAGQTPVRYSMAEMREAWRQYRETHLAWRTRSGDVGKCWAERVFDGDSNDRMGQPMDGNDRMAASLDNLTREVERFEARIADDDDAPELRAAVRAGVRDLQRALRIMKTIEARAQA